MTTQPALLPSLALALLLTASPSAGDTDDEKRPYPRDPARFRLIDVFELEWASDPQISPDGAHVVYVRNFMDRSHDRRRSNLWILATDGSDHRPLTTGNGNDGSPRWSPDGRRLAYTSRADGSTQLYLRWMDTGQTARLTQLTESPRGLTWSPDGRYIAFTLFVKDKPEDFVKLPKAPEGAQWAEPAITIDDLIYRADGRADFLPDGNTHIFVLSAEGGTPRQLTTGDFDHGGSLSWTPDGEAILFSANRGEDWRYEPNDSEVFEVRLGDASLRRLTGRRGPDEDPAVAPDGRQVAYLGYDDRYQGYQVTRLYVMGRDGGGPRVLTGELDRSVSDPVWSSDGRGIYFGYDDRGNGKVGYVSLDGELELVAGDVGGTSIGRPYSGGSFSVSRDGRVAFARSRPDHPADVAVGRRGSADAQRLTRLNDDLFLHKELGEMEEIWYDSSHDGRKIQGWIVKPPGFEETKKYPLVLEIHGGPFANYGDRFAAEIQLYAAAGYVVLYTNPRGSSSYGEEFGNLIHHAYPSHDFDDLMSGVDAVLARGYVDEDNLFVTGGSGGGVLTAWIVGHTDRFRAAVSAKPVINWYSFVLTADNTNFFYRYWFPGFPWDHAEHYLARSPLHYAGNVTTPTMLLTGEADYRTPISESEQFYQALKLRKVDAMLVRIPGASHGIAARPSNLMSKVAHVLGWFEKYRGAGR